METKKKKIQTILKLKCEIAETEVAALQTQLLDIREKMVVLETRRKTVPAEVDQQLIYQQHLHWIDKTARDLSIEASQVMVKLASAKQKLRAEFGRKDAYQNLLKRAAKSKSKRGQLS